MKAVEIKRPGEMALIDAEIPTPPAGFARVKVVAAAVCATDLEVKEQLVKESLHDQLLSYKNDYILQYYTAQTGNLQGRCKKNRRREYSSTCANCFGSLPVTGQAFPLCRRI